MAYMSVNCVLVVISLLVSWFSTSLYVEGKSDKGGEREPFIMNNISAI